MSNHYYYSQRGSPTTGSRYDYASTRASSDVSACSTNGLLDGSAGRDRLSERNGEKFRNCNSENGYNGSQYTQADPHHGGYALEETRRPCARQYQPRGSRQEDLFLRKDANRAHQSTFRGRDREDDLVDRLAELNNREIPAREPQEEIQGREDREARRDPRKPRKTRDPRETSDFRETRDPRETRDFRETRDPRETADFRETWDPTYRPREERFERLLGFNIREVPSREQQEETQGREDRGARHDPRGPRDPRDSRYTPGEAQDDRLCRFNTRGHALTAPRDGSKS